MRFLLGGVWFCLAALFWLASFMTIPYTGADFDIYKPERAGRIIMFSWPCIFFALLAGGSFFVRPLRRRPACVAMVGLSGVVLATAVGRFIWVHGLP